MWKTLFGDFIGIVFSSHGWMICKYKHFGFTFFLVCAEVTYRYWMTKHSNKQRLGFIRFQSNLHCPQFLRWEGWSGSDLIIDQLDIYKIIIIFTFIIFKISFCWIFRVRMQRSMSQSRLTRKLGLTFREEIHPTCEMLI